MTEITWSDVGYEQGQVAESCCTQDRKGISTNVLLYVGGLSCINGELFFFFYSPRPLAALVAGLPSPPFTASAH